MRPLRFYFSSSAKIKENSDEGSALFKNWDNKWWMGWRRTNEKFAATYFFPLRAVSYLLELYRDLQNAIDEFTKSVESIW